MNFISRRFVLFILLATCSIAQQTEGFGDGCCATSCYECSCEPLYCGAFGVLIQGGFRPIIWRNRGNFFGVNCVTAATNSQITVLEEIPKFRHFYKYPWEVGGQLSYALSCNTNVFVEVNYAQARNKKECNVFTTTGFQCANPINPVSGLAINLSKYKIIDAYVGANYYFNRWCDRVAFFFGGKVGLVHHNKVHYNSLTAGFNCSTGGSVIYCTTNTNKDFFLSNTVVAGGAQAGFDICFCGNWSLVVTGNVIASCGPKSIDSIALNTTDMLNLNGVSTLLIGHVETELAFPILVGIKYNF